MQTNTKAYLIGGGIGSLAAAAFLIRDGAFDPAHICIMESAPQMGGALDGAGDPDHGYSMRGGRMLTTDNYECTWALFKSIPSISRPGSTVFEETEAFNELHVSNAKARLVDSHRARLPVVSMGFSMHDRLELLKLSTADEFSLGTTRITDHFSAGFFETEFWYMWATTFAFQPWHSAVEFRRYLHRFMLEFTRINTLAGVKRTALNQYDALVVPLQHWLKAQGVVMQNDCTVTDLLTKSEDGHLMVIGIERTVQGQAQSLSLNEDDLVFLQNGSMTDASSIGSMTAAPAKLDKARDGSWTLWEKLARGRPSMGKPAAFNSGIAQSYWASFTVTLKDHRFFDLMQTFTGNEAGTGGLVTFKDSNWLMSIVLAHQPHFANQPDSVQVFWGYSLFPDRVGNFVAKPMADCNGLELLEELCGHLRIDMALFDRANCLPCRMPFITSMFMPRAMGDRPLPVPPFTRNLAFVSQFVEIEQDVVFTVEYSIRAAQMAVYELLGLKMVVPPVTPHDKSLVTQFEALLKAMA